MGKSTAARFLLQAGVSLIDTDDIARQLTAPGSQSNRDIADALGSECLSSDGALRRDVVARIIFETPPERAKLESILHPRIHAIWSEAMASWRQSVNAVGAVVIPLLFEKGYECEFDAVVSVNCTATTQAMRLAARGWSEDHLRQRIASQLPSNKKMDRADFVVWTEGDLEVHRLQWQCLLQRLGVSSSERWSQA